MYYAVDKSINSKLFFLKRNWLQNNYSNTVSLGRFGKKIIMTMRCYKTIYVYILCMYVQTHIFIISKYEVKDAQVLYYITESISVRLGKWRRRPIFAINIDIFRFLFLFHQTGFFFSKFSIRMTVYNFHIKSKSWLSFS